MKRNLLIVFALLLVIAGALFSVGEISAPGGLTVGYGGPLDAGSASATRPNKIGLVANLPTNCTVGDTYLATDGAGSQILYAAKATGAPCTTWTVVGDGTGGGGYDPYTLKPTVVDDFWNGNANTNTIGMLRWVGQTGATGGLINVNSADISPGHPGVLRMASGTGGATIINSPTVAGHGMAPGATFDYQFDIKLLENDSGIDVLAGVNCSGSLTAVPATGMWIEKLSADTSWFGVTDNAGTKSRTAALAATSTNWVKLRVWRVNGTTLSFSVNGAGTQTITDNVSATYCTAFIAVNNTSGSGTRSVSVDRFVGQDKT